MNTEILAEWFLQQGIRVYRTKSSHWAEVGPRICQAFPYHWKIEPSNSELSSFMVSNRIIGLRYSRRIENFPGKVSYHAIYRSEKYDLDNLGKWAKRNTKRGLRNCTIGPMSFDALAKEGWVLQIETLERQNRRLRISKNTWARICFSARDLPGFKAWGARVKGDLAASIITFKLNRCGYLFYQQSRTQYMTEHVNNALSFAVTKYLIGESDIDEILYGLHSLDAPPSVDEFKFRMGYQAEPVRQRVAFHPAVRPFMNRASYRVLLGLSKWRTGSPLLAKAEGLVRFYLEGKKPLAAQKWPAPLQKRKDVLLNNDEQTQQRKIREL